MTDRDEDDGRMNNRRNKYKKAIDADDFRRQREDENLQIRKKEKDQELQKKRLQAAFPQDENAAAGADGADGAVGAGVGEAAPTQDDIPKLMQMVFQGDDNAKLEGVKKIRQLLSIEKNPPIASVIDCGVVPTLIDLLKREDIPDIQFESAWALTNIASGSQEETAIVIDNGAIPIFVALLNSPVDKVREQAVWGLGNISGDSAKTRDAVLQANALTPIINLVTSTDSIELVRNATWTISNLCRGRPPPQLELVYPCLQVLQRLVYSHDNDVIIDAFWALSYFCDGERTPSGDNTKERVDAIIKVGVCRRAVELLESVNYLIVIPALRLVGNICTGTNEQTDFILECDVLARLNKLLEHPRKNIRKETCWTFSNITAGYSKQIDKIINEGCIQRLVAMWHLDSTEMEIKQEITWALRNALATGTPDQLKFIVQHGVIDVLCGMISPQTMVNPKICLVAVEGLLQIFERCARETELQRDLDELKTKCQELGLVDNLWRIMNEIPANDKSHELHLKTQTILNTYFNEEEELHGGGDINAGFGEGFQFGGGDGGDGAQGQGGFNFGN